MIYPKSIQKVIDSFQLLPGIGEKTAERFAFSILELEKEEVEEFSNSIKEVKEKIKKCEICNHITEESICEICKDKNRKKEIICVVEDPKKVILFEKIGSFSGKYHVLGGLISPLDGIGPEDVNIDNLLKRVDKENINEIILAIKPGIEGETTSLYINKLLEGYNIKVSKIAHGIPIGAEMEYIDALTLEKALEERKEII